VNLQVNRSISILQGADIERKVSTRYNRLTAMPRTTKSILALLILFILSYLFVQFSLPKSSPKSEVEGTKTISTPTPSPASFPSQPPGQDQVIVTKVTDGDTIHVLLNGRDTTIRIIGIDTPETVDPRKPVQCMGKAASDRAKVLLSNKTVVLESDPTQGDKDKYGRLLRYVFIDGSDDYGLGAILEGFAHEYTYNAPYKYQSDYKKAEKSAMKAMIGLWADNACTSLP